MRKGPAEGDDRSAPHQETETARAEWDALLARSRADPSMKARTRTGPPRKAKARRSDSR